MSLHVLPVALCMLVLAACGGSDDTVDGATETPADSPAAATAPAEYIDGLCTAITSYQNDLETQGASFQEDLSAGGTPSPEETKVALSSFLGTAAERTEQLIDEVDALGAPDVDNGDEVRTTFTTAFEKVVELFNSARADVDGLPVGDPAALAEGFTEAATKLQEAGTEIGASFADLSSPELDDAAAEAESCAGIV